jgi:diguanylate cyclase (GGDEF)-like protein
VLRETTLKEGQQLADRLLRGVRAIPTDREGGRYPLTLSVGIAALSPGEEARVWIERADKALYQAKRDGRDRTVVSE